MGIFLLIIYRLQLLLSFNSPKPWFVDTLRYRVYMPYAIFVSTSPEETISASGPQKLYLPFSATESACRGNFAASFTVYAAVNGAFI